MVRTRPWRSLYATLKEESKSKLWKEPGTRPDRWLWERFNFSKLVRLEIWSGMLPEKLLELKSRTWRLEREESKSLGRRPVKPLPGSHGPTTRWWPSSWPQLMPSHEQQLTEADQFNGCRDDTLKAKEGQESFMIPLVTGSRGKAAAEVKDLFHLARPHSCIK